MKRMKITYLLVTILALSSCKKAANTELPTNEQELMVSTFAGAGGASYKDGTGEGAAFNRPNSMTADGNGNLFVVDKINLRIRKVTPEGVVSTFGGDGTEGFVNGTGTAAKFGYNDQIACDAQNNLYLTDPSNSCIRKITPNGVFSTFTTNVQIESYADIAVDPSNNIYYIDKRGVGKITPSGTVSIIVRNGSSNITGPIATASIPNPNNVCADKSGNVFVSSYYNSNAVIFKIGTDGMVSVYAGSIGADEGFLLGLASVARFLNVKSMTTDQSGNVLIIDNNHVITKVTTDGFVKLVAGFQYTGTARTFIPGPAASAVFGDLTEVAVSPDGTIYALEDFGYAIRKIALVDKPSPALSQNEKDKANWNKPTNWK